MFYFKPAPGDGADGQPYGFVEVSPALRAAARSRGLFDLGFDPALFHVLKPMEQRLAVYLAKQFASQQLHRRFVPDLARALPIEAARERDVRATLRAAAAGLVARALPTLATFKFEVSRSGVWLATFVRGSRAERPFAAVGRADPLPSEVEGLLVRIADAVGSDDDRGWWVRCAARMGVAAVDHALGLLKEVHRGQPVVNPGGLLTKILKDLAAERGVLLTARSVRRLSKSH